MTDALKQCEVMAVRKQDGGGNLKAFADIRIGGALIIKGCAVMEGKKGIFVSMPRKPGRNGWWSDVVVPADEIKSLYEREILKAWEEDH